MQSLPINLKITKQAVLKALARIDFWQYLKIKDPDFYTDERIHLKELSELLQDFYTDKLIKEDGEPYDMLSISIPPRMGKSYTLTNFCQWVLGIDPKEKIATVSYNENMAGDFSRFVRDGIKEEKFSPEFLVYSDVFPDTKIKHGDGSAYKWALDGTFFSYIGCGMNGSLTGKGFGLGIIDDPVKNAEEAFNELTLDKHYNFYKNTFFSRIEDGGKIIINHTRWASNDMLGCVIRDNKDEIYVYIRKMEVDSIMLCESLCSRKKWEQIKRTIDTNIVSANYDQEPIDAEGRMYKGFGTYTLDEIPTENTLSYVDTADTGADFLCSIAYKVKDMQAYVVDIIYTNEPMEVTEPLTAQQCIDHDIKIAMVESNNGGRGFARNVERILKDKHNSNSTSVEWFHQGKNKDARIFAQSHWCTKNIFFPVGWARKWPEFYKALNSYQKEGKNKHDDAPDTLTGVAESIVKPQVETWSQDF
jgi:predicted phage terminase large subunit-like protein